jgi:hypothetical protein
MRTYSPFFQTLYDEQSPVGHLGRGTHYSVLRAAVFHDGRGNTLPETHYSGPHAQFHDFAVIWDEDHDTRVIKAIERIYFHGLLPFFAFIGERKGGLTALAFEDSDPLHHYAGRIITDICEDLGNDPWSSEMGIISNPQGIISDTSSDVILYLRNIQMLWKLGSKPIGNSPPQD